MQKKSILIWTTLLMTVAFVNACSNTNSGEASYLENTAGRMFSNATPSDTRCNQITKGDLNGFVPFSRDSAWNSEISGQAADPQSSAKISAYVNRVGYNPALHGDFSSEYGEVYNVVDSSTQPLQMISIDEYPGESDLVPVPLPDTSVVKGGSQNCNDGGDCHLFVLDRNQCWLYETWQTSFDGVRWHASNMAVWDMLGTSKRPYGWTAADAAGLSVFAGLVRYDEVARGVIPHAIRFTLGHTGNTFVAPATHSAGYDSAAFPMGTRFRLKRNFDVSAYSKADQVIFTAMKNYGLILADNGSDLEIAGANDARWEVSDVVALKGAHLSDFEVMPAGKVMSRADLPTGARAEIGDFSASSMSAKTGESVTLSWSTSGEAWTFIDVLGPVRGNSITVAPTATTTYTLNATNAYGRSTRSVTVEVN
ncbi:MAG: PKD domain-containing protein [Bdellovibrionales bacterium]|nr:PKD domain-containing protein [Oligoflexia bacterium]